MYEEQETVNRLVKAQKEGAAAGLILIPLAFIGWIIYEIYKGIIEIYHYLKAMVSALVASVMEPIILIYDTIQALMKGVL